MTKTVQEIHELALKNADKAALHFYLDKGHDYHGLCGFAWVVVKGVRSNSKIGKELLKLGFTRSDYEKGLVSWNPLKLPTQCIDAKSVATGAYAKTFRDHGINAYHMTRLD
jgi:hypothetical protein